MSDGTSRARTWRVTQIPRSVGEETLRAQLLALIKERNPTQTEVEKSILQLTLAPSTRGYLCATVTVYGSLPAVTQQLYHIDNAFLGITPLYEDSKALVDIIAVPGLGSHALGSFKNSGSFAVWLRDFLPLDVHNIRVLLYGYDTTLAGSDSKSSIRDYSKSLLESIRAFRAGTETEGRPIVFIGHSLGGLLIKEALVLASSNLGDRQSRDFSLSISGLIFFGVPNLGLRQSQLEALVAGQPNAVLIRDLVVDDDSEPSPYLKELSRKFIDYSRGLEPKLQIVSYYERRASPTIEASSLSNCQCSSECTFLPRVNRGM